ncbi:MAG TPA: hypothetical protein PK939_07440 [Bacteroidales bacterium]|nr:hypothetical protein [Bacteroidales bacterium]
MNQKYQSFFLKQFGLAAILAALSFYAQAKLDPAWHTRAWPFLLILFLSVNSLLFWMNQKAQNKKFSSFANYFMLASSLKLILYLGVIVAYLYYFRSETIPFLITIFVYYMAFTFLEVGAVIKKNKS